MIEIRCYAIVKSEIIIIITEHDKLEIFLYIVFCRSRFLSISHSEIDTLRDRGARFRLKGLKFQ